MSIKLKSNGKDTVEVNFLGKHDEIVDINSLVEHSLNIEYRKTETSESKDKYYNLEKDILRNGLSKAIEVSTTTDGKHLIESGHTRTKILKTNGIVEVPVIIQDKNIELKDEWNEAIVNRHLSDNIRVETPQINRYFTVSKIKEEYEKRNIEVDKTKLEEICDRAGISYPLYNKAKHLDFGYTNKNNQWVQPRPDLMKDLVEGVKNYATISKCHGLQKKDHDIRHNPKSRDYSRNSDLEKVLENIDDTFVSGTKEYINKVKEIRVSPYPNTVVFDNSDDQNISSYIHYAVSSYYCEEINKSENFTAKVSNKSDHYDIYVYDTKEQIVATIETKTTQSKNWTSGTPKGGYHLLLAYNKQLTNFYTGIVFIDSDTWSGGIKGTPFSLKCKDVFENNEYIWEYAGELAQDGDSYNVFKTKNI